MNGGLKSDWNFKTLRAHFSTIFWISKMYQISGTASVNLLNLNNLFFEEKNIKMRMKIAQSRKLLVSHDLF